MAAVNLRDIPLQIQIEDSCNCRCCLPFWRRNKPAYVTRSYIAEPFSPAISTDQDRDRRASIERINNLLTILHQHQLIPEPIEFQVEPHRLTFREIERINAQIRQIMRKKM